MKTTAEMIEVMQASIQGDVVQRRFRARAKFQDGWVEVENPLWNWDSYDYRIKPEPKEIWVNKHSGNKYCAYDSKDEAENAASTSTCNLSIAVKYREVVDDE